LLLKNLEPVLRIIGCNTEYTLYEVLGSGGIVPTFLTSALDGDEWSASSLSHFTPEETAPHNHCIEAGRAPQVWMLCRRDKSLASAGNRIPISSSSSPVTIPTELSRLPILKQWFCGMLFLQSFYQINGSVVIPPYLIITSTYIMHSFPSNTKLRIICTLNNGCNAMVWFLYHYDNISRSIQP
jgi:hypothetical protein